MPKKRSHGDGGLYLDKKRGLWRGVIDVGFWPDGRRRQKVVTSKSQARARQKLNEIRDEIRDHGEPIDKRTTVAVWADHWLTTVCLPNLKPNTFASYESLTRAWIIPTLGTKPVALVKPSDIRSVHKAIADSGRSSSTARKAYAVMSRMFESARVDGIATRNVAADVEPPTIAVSDRGALDPAAALEMLRTSALDADGTRWWVALLCGLRQSERLGARISSLDLDAGILNVDWTLDEIASKHGCGAVVDGTYPCGQKRGGNCPKKSLKIPDGFEYIPIAGRLNLVRPKSGKSRAVPIIPALVEALRRYLSATELLPNPHGLIWRHDDGSPFLPHEDNTAWRDLLYRAGVVTAEQAKAPKDREEGTEDIPTTHWARHTTVTVLMELGVDPKIVGEIVGHQSDAVTRKYQHVSSPVAREAMERIGAHFEARLNAGSVSPRQLEP